MQILPPDVLFDKRRFFSDLMYRREVDLEMEAERSDRLRILFLTTTYMTDEHD